MMLDLPEPVSPTSRKCLFSALRGIRSGCLSSLVVIPIPLPATAFVNCLAVTRTGPLRRRPYRSSFRLLISVRKEKGSCKTSATTPQYRGPLNSPEGDVSAYIQWPNHVWSLLFL